MAAKRTLAATLFMTLDGVVEAPDKWSFPFWSDETGKFKSDELRATDALLLGRVTYEGFAAAWPGRKDEEGFADRFNSIHKYVASKTRKGPRKPERPRGSEKPTGPRRRTSWWSHWRFWARTSIARVMSLRSRRKIVSVYADISSTMLMPREASAPERKAKRPGVFSIVSGLVTSISTSPRVTPIRCSERSFFVTRGTESSSTMITVPCDTWISRHTRFSSKSSSTTSPSR